MREQEVIDRLRRIATSPEARGLLDDVAVQTCRIDAALRHFHVGINAGALDRTARRRVIPRRGQP